MRRDRYINDTRQPTSSSIWLSRWPRSQHVLIAVVVNISWSSPDYYLMLVMQSIFRNWVCALSSVSLLSSRLLDIIAKYNLAISYMFFSTSYSDTCLWGTYLVSENLANLLYAPQVDPEEHRANSG
jgi:predicted Zn-dependent peptidase